MTGRCGLYSEREFRPRIYSVRLLRVVPCLDTMTYRRLASDITRAYDTSLNELRESPDIGWRGYSGSISCERFIALSKARAASATSQAVGSAHRLRVTT